MITIVHIKFFFFVFRRKKIDSGQVPKMCSLDESLQFSPREHTRSQNKSPFTLDMYVILRPIDEINCFKACRLGHPWYPAICHCGVPCTPYHLPIFSSKWFLLPLYIFLHISPTLTHALPNILIGTYAKHQ